MLEVKRARRKKTRNDKRRMLLVSAVLLCFVSLGQRIVRDLHNKDFVFLRHYFLCVNVK